MQAIFLYPGGYPVHIDVSEADINGAGTAMRFVLPAHGVNLPLMHQHEQKLIVALAGQLKIRVGATVVARLNAGQAITMPAGTPHRISQDGPLPSMVGVALWPGAVERAFTEIARLVEERGFNKSEVMEIFARFGVTWHNGASEQAHHCACEPASVVEMLGALPEELALAIADRWQEWM